VKLLARLRRFVDRLGKVGRRDVSLSADGFVSAGRVIRWDDIATILAFQQDIQLGKVVCLAIAAMDGTTCYVAEGDPLWLDALEAIDRHLPGALPKERWFPDVAAGRRGAVAVYGSTAEKVAPAPE
jgi:hypothetical protein